MPSTRSPRECSLQSPSLHALLMDRVHRLREEGLYTDCLIRGPSKIVARKKSGMSTWRAHRVVLAMHSGDLIGRCTWDKVRLAIEIYLPVLLAANDSTRLPEPT